MDGNYGGAPENPSDEPRGTQPAYQPPPQYPPPQPPAFQSPYIGESSKIRSLLDLLNITKILALVVGIIGFVVAVWEGISFAIFAGWIPALFWAVYDIIVGVINFLIYMKVPEFDTMVRSRRYVEAKSDMLLWGILGLIFGFIAGLLLLLGTFLYLEELERYSMYQQPPPPQQGYYPPPP